VEHDSGVKKGARGKNIGEIMEKIIERRGGYTTTRETSKVSSIAPQKPFWEESLKSWLLY
jgi:hypothetical protein